MILNEILGLGDFVQGYRWIFWEAKKGREVKVGNTAFPITTILN